MDEHRNVTDSEWKIMDQLWKNGEMTMTQITRALEEETGWSKHTVISLLKRMCQKGSAEIVPETSPMRADLPQRRCAAGDQQRGQPHLRRAQRPAHQRTGAAG